MHLRRVVTPDAVWAAGDSRRLPGSPATGQLSVLFTLILLAWVSWLTVVPYFLATAPNVSPLADGVVLPQNPFAFRQTGNLLIELIGIASRC